MGELVAHGIGCKDGLDGGAAVKGVDEVRVPTVKRQVGCQAEVGARGGKREENGWGEEEKSGGKREGGREREGGGERDEGGGAGAEGGGEWRCFANVFDISALTMSPAGCSETCDSQGTQNTHSTKIKSVAPLLSAGARNTKMYISPVFRTPKKKNSEKRQWRRDFQRRSPMTTGKKGQRGEQN